MEKLNRYHKKVLLPITIPKGDNCWGFGLVCPLLNHKENNFWCAAGFSLEGCIKTDCVLKPQACKDLRDV